METAASVRSPSASIDTEPYLRELQYISTSVWRRTRPATVRVTLTTTHFELVDISSSKETESLAWTDVLGAHILTEDGIHLALPLDATVVDTSATYILGLFTCAAKPSINPNKPKRRHLKEWLFRFSGAVSQQAIQLHTWINYLCDPRSLRAMQSATSLQELVPISRPSRKFLVIINPVGGQGKGQQIYDKQVAPLFKFASIETEIRITDRALHAGEIVKEIPLHTYDCVVAVGGDGTLCEIFQGLMKRDDWFLALKQVMGIIPSGSGNGMVASMMHEQCERYKPLNAAYILVKGVPHPLDITAVRNPMGDIMYSFLSTEWALIADCDIESESLRALGGARFTVKMLQLILLARTEYRGIIWYLEEKDGSTTDSDAMQVEKESTDTLGFDLLANIQEGAIANDGSQAIWRKLEGGFRIVWIMNVTHAASDAQVAPGAQLSDGFNYMMILEGQYSTKDLLTLLLSMEDGTHVEKVPEIKFIKTRAFKVVPERSEDRICIDGELFEGPVEAQVHRQRGRIMTLPGPHSLLL